MALLIFLHHKISRKTQINQPFQVEPIFSGKTCGLTELIKYRSLLGSKLFLSLSRTYGLKALTL